MVDIIRKLVIEESEAPVKEKHTVYEKVSENVEQFTVENLDQQIANLQKRIAELETKKASALALDK